MNFNRNYTLLCIIALLQGFVFYDPIATIYRQSRGISIYDIFLIESIFMVLMILFEVPWGIFADRYGYKTTLIISLFINFITKIIFYKAYSFGMFLLERVLLAVSVSGMSGCDAALLFNSVGKSKYEKAYGRYYSFTVVGFLIATSLSGLIVSVSMDLAAYLTIFPYGIAAAAAFFLKDSRGSEDNACKIVDALKMAFTNKKILIFLFSIALINESTHAIATFLNQIQYQRSGIDIKYYGIILVLVELPTLLASKSYTLSQRFGHKRILLAMFGIIGMSSIGLISTSTPISSVLLIAVISLSCAITAPISSDIQNNSIDVSNRATMLSVYAIIINLVSAAVNLGIGKSAEISIRHSFGLCAALSCLAIILCFYYFKSEQADESL